MASDGKVVTLFIPVYSQGMAIGELARQIHGRASAWLDIRIVANGSPPAVLDALRATGIPLVELEQNAGYGGAVQRAIPTATTPYVAWMPGNLKIAISDFERQVEPLLFDATLRAAKGVRTDRPQGDIWRTRILSLTQSILARKVLSDGGAPPTLVARELVPLIANGPRGYGFDHWVLWRLLTNRVEVRRFPIRYVSHASVASTWNLGTGDLLRMFVQLNREVLDWESPPPPGTCRETKLATMESGSNQNEQNEPLN